MEPGKLYDQARAKILWGQPADAVREFLTSKGLSNIETDRKIAEWQAERNADIRKIGIKKILVGGSIMAAAIVLLTCTGLRHPLHPVPCAPPEVPASSSLAASTAFGD